MSDSSLIRAQFLYVYLQLFSALFLRACNGMFKDTSNLFSELQR